MGDLQEREQSVPVLINMLEKNWLKKDDNVFTYGIIWKTIAALGKIGEREQAVPILFSKLQNISKEGGFNPHHVETIREGFKIKGGFNAGYVETIYEALEEILSLGRFEGQYS